MAHALALLRYYLEYRKDLDACLEEMQWISLQGDMIRCNTRVPASLSMHCYQAVLCQASTDPLCNRLFQPTRSTKEENNQKSNCKFHANETSLF